MDELCNVTPNPNQPYVGTNAFAHKGGMHVAGVNATRAPSSTSTRARWAPTAACSSRSSRAAARSRRAPRSDDATAARVVERVKELESRGYQFEAADGSFDLLIRKETGEYEPLFRLESWRAIVEKREDGRVQTEATIKIWVEGERYVQTAEGNGPVNALDKALRLAIGERYPHLRDIELVNFKVRILDEVKGTGAVTRVLLDASDGRDTWGSIGVSENVIEASWEALVDSLEAGMLPARRARRTPDRRLRQPPARPRRPTRMTDWIPLARPARGRARGGAGARDAALAAGCRWARGCRSSRRHSGARSAPSTCRPSRAAPPALHLAIRAAGIEPGDEVVTTPFSFVASANCLLYEDARPVFCDIDPRTLNIDPEAAAAAVTERTTGLLPGAHLRLPRRHAGLRAPGARARAVDGGGRLRGARRGARRRDAGRRPREPRPSSASTRTSS